MKTIQKTTIPDHWDTAGLITKNSDPFEEFEIWKLSTLTNPAWEGDEFSIADFREYIDSLNK